MNKIAEDIIFLKDNMEKVDCETVESIRARKEIKEEKEKRKKGRGKRIFLGFIISVILAKIIFETLKVEYVHLPDGKSVALILTSVLFILHITHPIAYVFSTLLTYYITELVCPNPSRYVLFGQSLSREESLIVVGVFVALVVSFIVKLVKWGVCRWIASDIRPSVLPAEKEDELTKKLCSIADKYSNNLRLEPELFTSEGNLWRQTNFVEKIDEGARKYYPAVRIPEEKEVNRDALRRALLSSAAFGNVVRQRKELDAGELAQILSSENEILYVNNDYREGYLRSITELLTCVPQFKFNIDAVTRLGERMLVNRYWDGYDERMRETSLKYRRLGETVKPILESDAYRKIERLYQKYKEDLKTFNNDLKGTFIGADGERGVAKALEDFERIVGSDKMRVLPNIRMEPNGMSVESDFIVVCQYGIFALEVKNLGSTGSYNITVEKDGLWKKVMKNGRWKEMPDSISRQNERHLMGIEQVINSRLNRSSENWISAKSLIVFANNVVGIRNYSNNIIIRESEIMTEIRKNPICLNEQQIQEISEILFAENLPAKQYKMENWMEKILAVHLELAKRTQDIYPYLEEYLEIAIAYNYKINVKLPLPDYQVTREEFSMADDESEYQKSKEEIDYERKVEEEKWQEARRKDHENAEWISQSQQMVYEDEPSAEEKYFSFDAFMHGETRNVYYQEYYNKRDD